LQAFVRERLAGFKVPTHVVFVEAPLPRNAAGKMLKRELRDTLAG
jgi:acyl-coenzyme A synthetase/AMP-(fatty) acid ligase